MCGRYADFLEIQDLVDAFNLMNPGETPDHEPRFNVAPTQLVRVVRQGTDGALLDSARWGLVPSWAKDPSVGVRMINARLEGVQEKPSFRTAFAKRRCIVPASGYYEWQAGASGKVPHFIHAADAPLLAMAGLLEAWRPDPQAPWLITCAVVTTAARGDLAAIHDRQPVMMTPETWPAWLDPASSTADAMDAALAPGPALEWHPVGAAVGNVRNDSPELVERVEPPLR